MMDVSMPLASPVTPRNTFPAWTGALLCLLAVASAIVLLFVTAPKHEDFWWTDGATFALNGELIRDYLASGLGQNPMAFASAWFLRYPALTISLYPPIFPMVEAAVFAIFGFSHAAAQATVTGFAALAAYGAYRVCRSAVPMAAAAGGAILLLSTPGVLLWSRQVVMEVPTLAFLLLAAAVFLHHQRVGNLRSLLLAVLFLLAAVYTKQTAIFIAAAFAAALILDGGLTVLRKQSTWIAVAIGIAGLVPLTIFTLLYASQNIDSAIGAGTSSIDGHSAASRLSVAAFLVYGRALTAIVGPLPLAASAVYLALLTRLGWRHAEEKRLTLLMLCWFVADYVMISVIGHFEHRYGIFLTVPPVVLSVLLAARVLHYRGDGTIILPLAVLLFALGLASAPVTRITGYDAVAQYIVDHTHQDSVVLFHGKESKNFTFSVRVRTPHPKIFIVRADKELVKYNIVREWGITDRNLSEADIEGIVDRYGIEYVVSQPGFWTDQPSMAKLEAVLHSNRFTLVAEFPIESEEPSQRTTIRIYRNNRPVPASAQQLLIEMPALGRAISGQLNGR